MPPGWGICSTSMILQGLNIDILLNYVLLERFDAPEQVIIGGMLSPGREVPLNSV